MSWSHFFTFLSGAAVLALVQRFLPPLVAEAWRFLREQRDARRVVALQLDPLLKAADELYGKVLALAKEDFTEFRDRSDGSTPGDVVDLCSTLYLFSQLWARLEILRRESFHAELARDKRGARILKFVHTLESKQVRLVDRGWQRAIGESLIVGDRGTGIRPFREVVEMYESSERLRTWFQPLSGTLRRSDTRKVRQRLLQYGVIVHAMIDTLDPNHYTTKDRPGYPNKLTRRARRDLIGRVFRIYLPDVKGVAKYTGTL
jgi:hypothetical protein